MRELIKEMNNWIHHRRPFAVATVIETWGSAPRQPGSMMIIDADNSVRGSVSGGCVENAVIAAATGTISDGDPQLLEYGVSHNDAWSAGLTCGGRLTVLLERHMAFSHDDGHALWTQLAHAVDSDIPVMVLTQLAPPWQRMLVFTDGDTVGDWTLDTDAAIKAALSCYVDRRSQTVELCGSPCFVHVLPRRDRLLIIGAAHIAIPLVTFARELNFETTLIDPRRAYATPTRFPVAPETIIPDWPDTVLADMELNTDTYAVVLSHDPKIDDAALITLLRSPVSYIGALGSRKTHEARCKRLTEKGFGDGELGRIHAPIGLDIHARTPSEIALSIIAQVVQMKYERALVPDG